MLVLADENGLSTWAVARGLGVFVLACASFGSVTARTRNDSVLPAIGDELGREAAVPLSESAPKTANSDGEATAAESEVSTSSALADGGSLQDPVSTPQPEHTVEPPPQEPSAQAPAEQPAPAEEPAPAIFPEPPPSSASLANSPLAPAPLAASQDPNWLHGSFAVRYRGRTTSDDSDNDLRAFLALDINDFPDARISGHIQARLDLDLDGNDADGEFGGLDSTYDSALVSKLYLAYADIAVGARPENADGILRIGRQSDPRLPEVLRIDGVSYATRPMGEREIELGAYVGIPAHLYESSNSGDNAFGAFAEGRPWEQGRVRVDYMHIEEEEGLGAGKDDLISLGLWQQVSKSLNLEGTYSSLEGDPRDLRLRAMYANPVTSTVVRFGYFELLEAQRALVTELDPFYEQLLDYQPFRQANLSVSQPVSEHVILDLGFDARRVSDSEDVGEFNRNWERYFATTTLQDIFEDGFALAVTFDIWDDDDRDISAFGADFSYDPDARWEAAIGTYYSLYKYVFLELDEREDVRTFYVRTQYDLTDNSILELLYEFENDDFDTYHTLRLGARWRF